MQRIYIYGVEKYSQKKLCDDLEKLFNDLISISNNFQINFKLICMSLYYFSYSFFVLSSIKFLMFTICLDKES